MKYISNSIDDTYNFAKQFLCKVNGPCVIVLSGEIGAGKTTFTKGLSKAMNISSEITSPTFTIMNDYYDGIFPLFHFDMYRIQNSEELIELGLSDYLTNNNSIRVIEWAQNTPEILPNTYYEIIITKLNDTSRNFEVIERK